MFSYVIVCRLLCLEGLFVSPVCDSCLVLSVPSSVSYLSIVSVCAIITLDIFFVRVPTSASYDVLVRVTVCVCAGYPVCVPVVVPVGVNF